MSSLPSRERKKGRGKKKYLCNHISVSRLEARLSQGSARQETRDAERPILPRTEFHPRARRRSVQSLKD